MPRLANAVLIPCSIASMFVIAACQRQPDAAPATDSPAMEAPTAAAAATPVTGAHPADVVSEIDNSTGPTDVEAKALAGVFTGTLPCADCPGIETTLRIGPDGRFTLHDLYQDRPDKGQDINGTWTAENGGKRIRLDPAGKDLDDRLYRIVSSNELEMLDKDGNPPDSDLDYSLKRSGVAK